MQKGLVKRWPSKRNLFTAVSVHSVFRGTSKDGASSNDLSNMRDNNRGYREFNFSKFKLSCLLGAI
jgi:hypothetical protein